MPRSIGTSTVDILANMTPAERAFSRFQDRVASSKLNFHLNSRSFTEPLGRITGRVAEFEKSLESSNARVLAFGASAGIIYNIDRAFRSLIRTSVEVNKKLADINVILGANAVKLNEFGNDLFDIAKKTGQGFTVVADAALELSRQGLSVQETLKRTRDALILTRLAGLDSVSSVEALTAAINSFNKVGLDSTQIINKLANVDAAFAISSADIAEAIKRVGSTAQDAGVGFDELLGIVTAVQQTTARGGPVIGNALKTIFTRIGRSDTIQQLKALGVEIDQNQSGIEKLKAIAAAIENADSKTVNLVKELAGGVFQINVVAAALSDLTKQYSIFSLATEKAASAQNEALERSDQLNKTLAAELNKTLVTLTKFQSQVGEATLGPTLRILFDSVNDILGSLDTNKDAQNAGINMGKAVLDGLGQFLSGPGLFAAISIVSKLFLNFARFAKGAVFDLFQQNKALENQRLISREIQSILQGNPGILQQIYSKSLSIEDAEKRVLGLLREQAIIRQSIVGLADQAAKRAGASVVVVRNTDQGTFISTKQTKKAASGLLPSDEESERIGALAGGYEAGLIKKTNIKGIGPVVYNTAEKIRDFGFDQPAIMPPKDSKAGEKYKKEFVNVHGFDPYKAGGLIPNFIDPFQFIDPQLSSGIDEVLSTFIDKSGFGPRLLALTGGLKPKFKFRSNFPNNDIRGEFNRFSTDQIPISLNRQFFGDKLDEAIRLNKGDAFSSLITRTLSHEIGHDIDFQQGQRTGDRFSSRQTFKKGLESDKSRFGKYLNELVGISTHADPIRESFAELIGRYTTNLPFSFEGLTNRIAIPFERLDSLKALKDLSVLPFAGGLIPAIKREMAGGAIPSSIRVGQSSQLASGLNPAGLGVFNTKDEPSGLNQGINRARAMGLNPKTHGYNGGLIPNFAPIESSTFGKRVIESQVIPAFEQLKKSLTESKITIDQAFAGLKSLSTSFNLTKETVHNLSSSLRLLEGSRKGVFPTALSVAQNRFPPGLKINFPPILDPAIKSSILPKSPIESKQIETIAKSTTEGILRVQATKNPIIGGSIISSPKTIGEKAAEINAQREARRGPPIVPLSGGPSASIAALGGRRAIRESGIGTEASKINRNFIVPQATAVQEQILKLTEEQINNFLEEARGVISGRKGGRAVTQLKRAAIDDPSINQRLNEVQQARTSRLQTLSLVGSIAAPIIAQSLSQTIDQTTKTGRVSAKGVEGIADIGSFAALGSVVGPGGALAGGLIGGLFTFAKVLTELDNNLPELNRNAENSSRNLNELTGGVQNYVIALENYQTALTDTTSKLSPQDILKRQGKVTEALLSIPERFRSSIASAAGSTEDLNKALTDAAETLIKQAEADKAAVSLRESIQGQRSILGGFFKEQDIFDKNKEGGQRLEKILGTISRFAGPELLKSNNQQGLITAGDKVLTGNTQDVKKNFEQLTKFLSDIQLPPALIDQIKTIGEESNDAIRLAAGLAELGRSAREAAVFEKQINEQLKENIRINKENKDKLQQFERALSNLSISLGTIVETAKQTTFSRGALINNKNQFNFDKVTTELKGLSKISELFSGPEKNADLDRLIQKAELDSQRIESFNTEILKSQNRFVDIVSSTFSENVADIVKLSLKSAAGEDLTDTERTQLAIADKQQLKLGQVIGESLRKIQVSPSEALPQNKEAVLSALKDTGLADKQISVISNRIDQLLSETGNNFAELIQKFDQQAQLQEIQNDLTKRLIEFQRIISIGGGASDFLGGSDSISKLEKVINDAFRNRFLQGNQRITEEGRTAFQFSDILRNSLQLKPNQVPQSLVDLSVTGRQQDLLKQLDFAAGVARSTLSPEDAQKIVSAIDELRGNSEEIARTQVSNQLKLEDLPQINQEINKKLEELNRLTKISDEQIQSKNETAFSRALKSVQLDQTNEHIDQISTTINDLIKIQLQAQSFEKTTNLQGRQRGIENRQTNESIKLDEINKQLSEQFNVIQRSITTRLPEENILPAIKQLRNAEQTGSVDFLTQNKIRANRGVSGKGFSADLGESGFVQEDTFNNIVKLLNQKRAIEQQSVGTNNELLDVINQIVQEESKLEQQLKNQDNIIKNRSSLLNESKNITKNIFGGPTKQITQLNPLSSFLGGGNNPITLGGNEKIIVETTETIKKNITAAKVESTKLSTNFNNIKEILKSISDDDLRIQISNANAELEKLVIGGKAFSSEIVDARNELNILLARADKLTFKGITDSLLDTLKFTNKDLFKSLQEGAVDLGSTMKSSFADAFKDFIKGSKSAEDALKAFGLNVLDKITDQTVEIATNQLFNIAGSALSGLSKNRGGAIKKYASGGRVIGGSGVRDDVPAFLQEGEYVLRKSVVQNVGAHNLDRINKFANGGNVDLKLLNEFLYLDNPKRPTRGATNVDPNLSSLALTDENNPQNAVRMGREEELIRYLLDLRAYNEQKASALRDFRTGQRRRLTGAYVSAAVNILGGAYQSYSGAGTGVGTGVDFNSTNVNSRFGGYANKGSYIQKYNTGGSADKIPAYLTGGEFVVNKNVVKKFGVPAFDDLNEGRIKKFQYGGSVGNDYFPSNPEKQGSGVDLDRLTKALESLNTNNITNPNNTNNNRGVTNPIINFTINVNQAKGTSNVESNTQNNETNNEDQENTKKFAELMKATVYNIITKEQKNGGLLNRAKVR
jgi:TP901 family phage tail tape measure protein